MSNAHFKGGVAVVTGAGSGLGAAMVGRFAELWLVQGYREYDFDEAVEQLSLLWANALRIPPGAPRSETSVRP